MSGMARCINGETGWKERAKTVRREGRSEGVAARRVKLGLVEAICGGSDMDGMVDSQDGVLLFLYPML